MSFRNWLRLWLVPPALAVFHLWAPPPVHSFPPYRSTDAGTADRGLIEIRLGLVQVEGRPQHNAYSSPLLRVNLGLPRNLELISEFDYRPDEAHVGEAALGCKWVPLARSWSVGVETLGLLPVSSRDAGGGVESQVLATLQRKAIRVHVNVGGFYDARPVEAAVGWRASLLAEFRRGRYRAGAEVFVKQGRATPVHVQAGPGAIIDIGPVDVRAGLHVGLTREAPNLTGSLWLTWKWTVW